MRTDYSLLKKDTWKTLFKTQAFKYCIGDTIEHIKFWIKDGRYDYWNC